MEAQNFSFFALGDASTNLQALNIDENGEPVRRRQRHTKSRKGCVNCKKRKVKCDETRPSCLGCIKRGMDCSLLGDKSPDRRRRAAPLSEPIAASVSKCPMFKDDLTEVTSVSSDDPSYYHESKFSSKASLILRRTPAEEDLIRDFEEVTSEALSWASSTWYLGVLDNARHCDYLMSAVMLVAASHINYYLPKHDPTRRPFFHHLFHALAGLQKALTEDVTAAQFEAVFACSILLIHHSWSYIDIDLDESIDVAAHFRETVALFHGLKGCVMAFQPVFRGTSVAKIMSYSPRATLEEYIREHDTSERSNFTKSLSHCMMCPVMSCSSSGASPDDYSAMQRLGVSLHAITLARPDFESAGVDYDIRRYLFTWPILCTDGFLQQIKENQPTSLMILLYYYAGILSISTSKKMWFMRDRALFMYRNLLAKLGGICETCTAPALTLYHESPTGERLPPTSL